MERIRTDDLFCDSASLCYWVRASLLANFSKHPEGGTRECVSYMSLTHYRNLPSKYRITLAENSDSKKKIPFPSCIFSIYPHLPLVLILPNIKFFPIQKSLPLVASSCLFSPIHCSTYLEYCLHHTVPYILLNLLQSSFPHTVQQKLS